MTEKVVVGTEKYIEPEDKKELTTHEILEMITRNQVTQNKNLKAIRNYLGFFVLVAILGLILGFCSVAL